MLTLGMDCVALGGGVECGIQERCLGLALGGSACWEASAFTKGSRVGAK